MTRVVLTHAAPRVERIAQRLAACGHDVVPLPTRTVVPLDATRDWPAELRRHDWVVFVSPGAIEVAFDALRAPWPADVGIALIGPGSVEALAALGALPAGVRVVHPERAPYDAKALIARPPFDRPAGLRVLVVRGERGRTDWIDALRAAGAQVACLALYRTQPAAPPDDALRRLAAWASAGAPAVFVFTGVESIDAVESLLEAPGACAWARAQRALAVHRRIADALAERGWRDTRVVEPGERGLLTGIESA